jgi:hypothetical protein
MQTFNSQQPKSKTLQAISLKSKGFYNLFKYVFCLQIIKLMSKWAKVKREIKGQGIKHLQR